MMIKHMMKYPTTPWHSLGIALLVSVTCANAEQPEIGKTIAIDLNDIKKQTIIQKPGPQTTIQKPGPQTTIQKPTSQKIQTNGNFSHRYTATFSQQLEHSGILTINNIRWQCNSIQKQCVTLPLTKTLDMQACQKLASYQNQKLRKFGTQKNMFNFSQINQCNATVQRTAKMQAPIKTVNQNATYKASTPNTENIGVSPPGGQKLHTPVLEGNEMTRSVKTIKFNRLSNKIKQALGSESVLKNGNGETRLTGGYGRLFSGNDCNDNRGDVNPHAAEVCDHVDNDCDGVIDEGQTVPYYLDADGDNHGDPSKRVDACPSDVTDADSNGEWLVRVGNDCDDSDPEKWHNCS